jgi:hypothetical protein
MTIKENIICSGCGQFEYRERTLKNKSTPEPYGYCKHYDRQTSADTFYAVCPGASPIALVIAKPKIVKKVALKETTQSSRK